MINRNWMSSYDLHFKGGEVITVDLPLYKKLIARINGTNTLVKPYMQDDGTCLFLGHITYTTISDGAMTEEDWMDQQLLEMEEIAEIQRTIKDDIDKTISDPVEITEEEIPTGAPDEAEECDHSDLPIGMVVGSNNVKRYFPFCPDCGHRGRLMRHADVQDTAIIVDLTEKK